MRPTRTGVAIVGGGISGLALGFHLQRLGVDFQVLEARPRAGGNIRSEPHQGYLCEWGPNGWLDNEPATARLVAGLGLQDQVVQASRAANRRWIVRAGRRRELPTKPPRFLTSDVLSLPGRLRVLFEWAQPARRDDADESVFDFAARRIGREAAEVLVDAMVTGIYAGDARTLSLASAFPRMRQMERRYGGLFKAMRAMRRESPRNTSRPPGAAATPRSGGAMGPGGTLTSFAHGIETIVTALVSQLGDRLQIASPVEGLERAASGNSWRLALPEGRSLDADRVVLASPAWKAAPLLESVDRELAATVGAIPSAPVAVVCLGWSDTAVQHLEHGFGFLVPGREKLPILGTLFDTWVFPNRSPSGRVLMRTMLGGARDPGCLDASDAQLTERALGVLRPLLGLRTDPEMVFVIRHARGIPQYPVGHPQTLARIGASLARFPGLYLTGNSYRGIAMNSCIKEAEALAPELAPPDATISA